MARLLLLVPSATYRARDFLDAARALGIEVVIGTEEAHALRDIMGSRTLEVPLDDPAEAARVIVAHDAVAPLDAVIAVDDMGTLVAAEASALLGLRHNPPDAVAAYQTLRLCGSTATSAMRPDENMPGTLRTGRPLTNSAVSRGAAPCCAISSPIERIAVGIAKREGRFMCILAH